METQILNNILSTLQELTSTVNELKEAQSRFEQRQIQFEQRQIQFEQRQIQFEQNQISFDQRLQNLESICLELREDMKTVYTLTMHNYKFLEKNFAHLGFNEFIYKIH